MKIQIGLIAPCGKWNKEKVVAEVREAKYRSVCADEAADMANKEQPPLLLRFDSTGTLREEFREFTLCDTGTPGAAIAGKIEGIVRELSVDPK